VKIDNLDLQKPSTADQLKVFFQYVAKHSKGQIRDKSKAATSYMGKL
jgi:hypothetical protein